MEKNFAQTLTINGQSISGPSDLTVTSISDFVTKIIPYVFAIAGIGLLLMILSAGFTLLTSAGDAKQVEAGKNRLTYAIVGFIVIFVAYWLVQIVGVMFGITEIQSIFGGATKQYSPYQDVGH